MTSGEIRSTMARRDAPRTRNSAPRTNRASPTKNIKNVLLKNICSLQLALRITGNERQYLSLQSQFSTLVPLGDSSHRRATGVAGHYRRALIVADARTASAEPGRRVGA